MTLQVSGTSPSVADVDAPDPPQRGHLTLIGTGHVLDIASKVAGAIQTLRPDLVFVELDPGRLKALEARRRGQEPPAPGGWLQKRMHAFQESVASEYGVKAGDEMLAAVHVGFQVGAKVALVDRPIQQTLQRVTKQVSWREKLRLAGMVVGGSIKSLFTTQSTKDVVERELADYNADPVATLTRLQERFPTIHRVVIAERDEWMAKRIQLALASGGRGVAVVGDGHIGGMLPHLDGLDVEVYRLPDVQADRLPAPRPGDTSSVSIGFDLGADDAPQPL